MIVVKYCCGVFISNGKDRDDSVGVDGDDSGDGGDGNYKAAGWWGYSENGASNCKLVLIMVTISGGSRLAWTKLILILFV
jgi:hypothetical protein